MPDETISSMRYRAGRPDRWIPLFVLVVSLLFGAGCALFSGDRFIPWGFAGCLVGLASAGAATLQWKQARRQILWDESSGVLEVLGGRRLRLEASHLTAVRVIPSRRSFMLTFGDQRVNLSLRLIRVENLIERLRARRPELFPPPQEELVLQNSWIPFLCMHVLIAGTLLAGWVLSVWQPAAGIACWATVPWMMAKAYLGLPRRYRWSAKGLTEYRFFGTKHLEPPLQIRQDGYASGGVVHLVMRFQKGRRSIVVDEGDLLAPLRPWSDWIAHKVGGPAPP